MCFDMHVPTTVQRFTSCIEYEAVSGRRYYCFAAYAFLGDCGRQIPGSKCSAAVVGFIGKDSQSASCLFAWVFVFAFASEMLEINVRISIQFSIICITKSAQAFQSSDRYKTYP